MKMIRCGSTLKLILMTGGCALAILVGFAPPAFAAKKTSASVSVSSSTAQLDEPSKLEGVIILSRHGNRPPLKDNAALELETSSTWPMWDTVPGYLTPRGRKLMVGMGGYYRDKFVKEGLLTGNDSEDVKHAYFHTNTIQRTVQTGCALAEGLFPSTTTTVHFLVNKTDTLYTGAPIDPAMNNAATKGRIGNNVSAVAEYMGPQFDLVERTLGRPGLYARKLSSIAPAGAMADNFMCEYCEGMSGEKFAFGRATPADLEEMLKLLALDFDLQLRTPYLARARMSNLISHMSATLEQIAAGKAVKGAFGDADDKLFAIVGHDTTLGGVAGVLRLDWVLPDTGRGICPPGGAIVFELRKRAAKNGSGNDEHIVRVYYATETLAQMHDNAKLSLEAPPTLAPLFVPGASQPNKWYDCPLQDFLKVANAAIDPALVFPIDDGERK